MEIAIDFDGTIVFHDFPRIGKPVPLALETLKQFKEDGHKLYLFTMRCGEYLQEAVDYCRDNGLEFDGVQVNPTQHQWTSSPKCYAQVYIDDAAAGVPLIYDPACQRPYVDWAEVVKYINQRIANDASHMSRLIDTAMHDIDRAESDVEDES